MALPKPISLPKPQPVVANNYPVFAGHYGGIRVRCLPKYKATLDSLVAMDRYENNYWARMIVRNIQRLVAGRLGLDNVFVSEKTVSSNVHAFFLMLPGCRAKFMRLNNGDYLLMNLDLDSIDYFEQMVTAKKPGLYRVEKIGKDWVADFGEKGRVENQVNRVVGITDRRNGTPADAAAAASHYLKDSEIADKTLKQFDMHFTPGDKPIRGLRRAYTAKVAPERDKDILASAALLAETMLKARKIEGVRWVAERGGSAVLIQAMHILANQGVKLEKHYVFLERPTTWKAVVEVAERLGIQNRAEGINLSHNKTFAPAEIGGLSWLAGARDNYLTWRYKKEISRMELAKSGAETTSKGAEVVNKIHEGAKKIHESASLITKGSEKLGIPPKMTHAALAGAMKLTGVGFLVKASAVVLAAAGIGHAVKEGTNLVAPDTYNKVFKD